MAPQDSSSPAAAAPELHCVQPVPGGEATPRWRPASRPSAPGPAQAAGPEAPALPAAPPGTLRRLAAPGRPVLPDWA